MPIKSSTSSGPKRNTGAKSNSILSNLPVPDVKRVAEENDILEPYVIVVGSPDHYSQAFLFIDGRLIGEIKDIESVPLVLLPLMLSTYATPKD